MLQCRTTSLQTHQDISSWLGLVLKWALVPPSSAPGQENGQRHGQGRNDDVSWRVNSRVISSLVHDNRSNLDGTKSVSRRDCSSIYERLPLSDGKYSMAPCDEYDVSYPSKNSFYTQNVDMDKIPRCQKLVPLRADKVSLDNRHTNRPTNRMLPKGGTTSHSCKQ